MTTNGYDPTVIVLTFACSVCGITGWNLRDAAEWEAHWATAHPGQSPEIRVVPERSA